MLFLSGAATAVQAQKAKGRKPLHISLPAKTWQLQVAADGFVVAVNESKADGRRFVMATSAATGITLSLTLEQVGQTATLDGCRQAFRERIQANASLKTVDVKESQLGEMAVLEFILPEAGGAPLHQKNVFGCLAKENVYADIHLSKAQFKSRDEALFMGILKSARFIHFPATATSVR